MRTLIALSALLLTTPAMSKTPDGEPPSVEDICDEFSGAAFGLCNAYCEAMDCDDPAVRASNTACEAVADNFHDVTGGTLLPCECPPDDPYHNHETDH